MWQVGKIGRATFLPLIKEEKNRGIWFVSVHRKNTFFDLNPLNSFFLVYLTNLQKKREISKPSLFTEKRNALKN